MLYFLVMEMSLHLTADESAAFAKLPPSLTKGLVVEAETLEFEDTKDRRKMRFELLRLSDPTFQAMQQRIAAAKNESEFSEVLKTLDFSKVGNRDFSRLLYALGPDALGLIIADVLGNITTRDDLDLLAALAGLRHLMLEALVEADF